MSEYLTDSLNQRYRATLALVAFLVLLNQLLVQPSLMRLTTDAPVINIAGRQRMLSQRLAKSALALESKTARRGGATLMSWTRYSGSGPRPTTGFAMVMRSRCRGKQSSRQCRVLDGLEPLFERMRTAADRLIRDDARGQPGATAVRDHLAIILGTESEYLERMDRIVGLFEREARTGSAGWSGPAGS